jgi:threonine/homoserine efflux transporter RhtA
MRRLTWIVVLGAGLGLLAATRPGARSQDPLGALRAWMNGLREDVRLAVADGKAAAATQRSDVARELAATMAPASSQGPSETR